MTRPLRSALRRKSLSMTLPAIAFFILSFVWVYRAAQHALFAKGYTNFPYIFHVADSVINSFLMPAIFFITGLFFYHYKFVRLNRSTLEVFFNWFIYLFILWGFIQNIVEVVFSGYTGSSAIVSDIYFDLTSTPSNHLWLIIAILVNLALLGFVLPIKSKVFSLFVVGLSVTAYLAQSAMADFYPLLYLPKYFIFTLLGALFYQYVPVFKRRGVYALGSIVIFMLFQYLFHGVFELQSYTATFFTLILAFSGVYFILALSWVLGKCCAITNSVVLAAVLIYLFHYTFVGGIREVLEKSLNYSNTYGHLCIGVLVGVLGPLVFYKFRTFVLVALLLQPPKFLSYTTIAQFLKSLFSRSKTIKVLVYGCVCGALLGYVGVYVASELRLRAYSQNSASDFVMPIDTLGLAEGKRLATIYGCYIGCHGGKLEGKMFHKVPLRGIYHSPNLTQSTIKYTNSELALMIKKGLRPNGRPIIAGMPSAGYSRMPNEHLSAILAFIRGQEKVNKATVQPKIGLLSRVEIATEHFKFQHDLIAEAEIEFPGLQAHENSAGQKWVHAACTECHGHLLQGNLELGAPPLLVARAYSYDAFKTLLQEGVNISGNTMGLMTQAAKVRFSNLTEAEIRAIYDYLNTLEF